MAAAVSKEVGLTEAAALPSKLSWGAIFGGTFVALGLWILLYAFGLAIGLTSINPDNPRSVQAASIFSGIWSLLAPLIALFFGSMVAARSAGIQDRGTGSIHGAVLWGLTTLIGLYLVANLVGMVVGGATRLVGGVVGGAGQSLAGMVQGGVVQQLGINWNDVLAPINQRLQAEGRPTVTAQQLQAATRDVVDDALRGQPLNRALLTRNIAENTNLTRADAEELANRIEQQVNMLLGQVGGIAQDVQRGALQAVEATGKALWWLFGSLLLGLIAAIAGATLGVSRRQRRAAAGVVREGTTAPPLPPVPPRREVYP